MQKKETLTISQFKHMLTKKIEQIDLKSLKADIIPFVKDPAPIQEWSKDMLSYFVTKMQYE
jgi:hypothetical protein